MTIGAALVTSGTTSTPATGKRPTTAVCRRWRGDVGGGAAAASVAALLRNTYTAGAVPCLVKGRLRLVCIPANRLQLP